MSKSVRFIVKKNDNDPYIDSDEEDPDMQRRLALLRKQYKGEEGEIDKEDSSDEDKEDSSIIIISDEEKEEVADVAILGSVIKRNLTSVVKYCADKNLNYILCTKNEVIMDDVVYTYTKSWVPSSTSKEVILENIGMGSGRFVDDERLNDVERLKQEITELKKLYEERSNEVKRLELENTELKKFNQSEYVQNFEISDLTKKLKRTQISGSPHISQDEIYLQLRKYLKINKPANPQSKEAFEGLIESKYSDDMEYRVKIIRDLIGACTKLENRDVINTNYIKLYLFYLTYDKKEDFLQDLKSAQEKEAIKSHRTKLFNTCELFYKVHLACKKDTYKKCELPFYFFRDFKKSNIDELFK